MILPDSFLRCLSPADRKALGKGGMTAEEAIAKQVAKNERQLQGQIVNLLRLKGIEPLWHRTDKKSAATEGWPDITFSINWRRRLDEAIACAWEVKFGDGELSQAQKAMKIRLETSPNNWVWREIRSVDEALAELRRIGIE